MPNRTKLELLSFGDLLCNAFNPLNIADTLQKNAVETLKREIYTEGNRIINEFKNVACRNYEAHHLERYIQTHQREAISLIDTAGKHLQSLNKDLINTEIFDQATSLYQAKIQALEYILNYFEKEQVRYFDINMAVPESYRIGSAALLNDSLNLLKAKLKSKSTDLVLQQLILDYLTSHCARDNCSYQQMIYAKLMIKHLLKLLSVNKDTDWDKRIIIKLIYLNFNTAEFFTYCRHYIAASVADTVSIAGQIAKFNWYAKEIKNIHVKPDLAYKESKQHISELLLTYISLELVHIVGIQSQVVEKRPIADLSERAEKFKDKLSVNLNVDQLALFIELFIRLKIIPIEKGKTMATINFFAQNITTIGTDSISALSLNKNRRPNPRTTGWMKDTLNTMITVLGDLEAE